MARTPATLKAMIAHVIDAEGPIFEDVLVDRIARAHGMQRSGNQIRRRVHCASACGRFEDRRGRAHSGLAVEQGCWGYPLFPQG